MSNVSTVAVNPTLALANYRNIPQDGNRNSHHGRMTWMLLFRVSSVNRLSAISPTVPTHWSSTKRRRVRKTNVASQQVSRIISSNSIGDRESYEGNQSPQNKKQMFIVWPLSSDSFFNPTNQNLKLVIRHKFPEAPFFVTPDQKIRLAKSLKLSCWI